MPHRTLLQFFAAFALSAFGCAATCAQTLQLDPLPPAPALPAENAATTLVGLLKEELRAIEAKTPEDEIARACSETRAQLRRLALDLLVRGTEGGGTRDLLAMQGFRLADLRRRVDVLLAGLADGSLVVGEPPRPLGVRERDVAVRRLRRFVELSPKAFAAASFDDPVQTEAAIANATAWLCDALATLEGRSAAEASATGWPTPADLTTAGAPAGAHAPIARSTDLDPCDPALRATAPAQTAAAIAERCAGPDAADAAAVATALALSTAAAECAWMTDGERASLDAAAAKVVRGDERSLLLRSAQASLLAAERRLAATKPAKEIDRAALEATMRRALFPESANDVAFREDRARLARVVQRVAEAIDMAGRFRAASERSESAPRELRAMRRDFEKAYRRAESTTFAQLSALLTDADALASPNLVSLTSAQRDALDDLRRLDESQRLIDSIGGARPQAARPITGHVRTMLKWLLEPSRRAAGLLTYDALSQQVAMFSPLPYEDALRRETPEATAMSAGEPRKLCDAIDLARAEWADAWGAGEGSGDAARRMASLYRLMRTMESFAPGMTGPESREAVASLSRWGGFYATRSTLAPALVDFGAVTKLAALAAIAGDVAALDRELDRIDRDSPLARLAGRMLEELGPWLAGRPGGATGALAAIRTPASETAWGLTLRPHLAAIARYSRELDFARRTGDVAREKPLLEYLSRLAGTALELLGTERSPVPTLPQLVEPTQPLPRRERK